MRGESPYASHGLLPGALDEDKGEERQLGIEAGYEWWFVADKIVFYEDNGWSNGMLTAMNRCLDQHKAHEVRNLLALGDLPLNEDHKNR
jgi:hypothetical protein